MQIRDLGLAIALSASGCVYGGVTMKDTGDTGRAEGEEEHESDHADDVGSECDTLLDYVASYCPEYYGEWSEVVSDLTGYECQDYYDYIRETGDCMWW